jgi:hypothetical protein
MARTLTQAVEGAEGDEMQGGIWSVILLVGTGEEIMRIARTELLRLVENLPETVEIEEVLYRLSLRERLEAAEEDIREGRVLSEDEVAAEIAQWFSG